ncbi:MAG: AraC family transcriptional regulator [Chlorobi bacterium]|nr:AraC family transcriptional regulator [Chlorobiota bacterium]
MSKDTQNSKPLKKFLLDSFLLDSREAFHIARTTISSQNDLVYHYHDYAELFWIKQGTGIHVVNGAEMPLQPGSLFMIRPSDAHTFKLGKPGMDMVITNIAFRKENLDFFRKRYFPGSDSFFWSNKKIPFTCQLASGQLNEVSALADRLIGQPRDFLHLDFIMLHIFRLITSLRSEYLHIPHWLAYALENYNSPEQFKRGTEGFIALAGRSPDHINRTLKTFLKQTLTETVNKAKLKFASQQLIMTNSPIKTICYDCGFDNVPYFHRLFKKYYGATPLEYQKRNHKIF